MVLRDPAYDLGSGSESELGEDVLDVTFVPRPEEAIEEGDQLMFEALNSPDFREGLNSYLEGRPPAFSGLAIS